MSALEALNTLEKNQLLANLKDAGLKLPVIQTIIKQRDVRSLSHLQMWWNVLKG